jgi:hypothetical protein
MNVRATNHITSCLRQLYYHFATILALTVDNFLPSSRREGVHTFANEAISAVETIIA